MAKKGPVNAAPPKRDRAAELTRLQGIANPTARQQNRINYLSGNKGPIGNRGGGPLGTGPRYDMSNPSGIVNTAIDVNRIGQNGPTGSYSYDENGNLNMNLSGNQQEILNQMEGRTIGLGGIANSQIDAIRNAYSQPFDISGAPNAPLQGRLEEERARIEDQAYQRFAREMDPRFEKELSDFDTQMSVRGIPIGSDLYNKQREQLVGQQNAARENARSQAIGLGGQEMDRMFNLGTQARQNYIGEQGMLRDRPMSEFGALQGQMSGPMMPQYLQTPQVGVEQLGLGWAGMQNDNRQAQLTRNWQGQQNDYDRQNQLAMKRMGGGGGGSEWNPDEYAQRMDINAFYSGSGPYAQQPKKPNQWSNAAAAAAGGFASGFGAGLAG